MLGFVLILVILIINVISYLKKKSGVILSFFLVFPAILPTLLLQFGIAGGAMLTRYLVLGFILIGIKRDWLASHNIIKKSPVFYGVVVLLGSILVFNSLSRNSSELVGDFQFDLLRYSFIPFFLVLLLLNHRKFVFDFVQSIPYWGILFCLIFLLFFDFRNIEAEDRFTFVQTTGFDTIASSRLFAISFIMSYVLLIKNNRLDFYLITSLLLSLLFLLITGQRGTLIGVFAGAVIFGFYNIRRRNFLTFVSITGSLMLLFYFGIIDLSKFQVFERFYELEDFKNFERYYDYSASWDIFKNNSYWAGEGSLGYFFSTERAYPHNILLESLAEYGLPGFLSMLSIVVFGFYYFVSLMRHKSIAYEYKAIAMVWVMLLVSVLVSGNMVDNGIFFVFSGILVNVYQFAKLDLKIMQVRPVNANDFSGKA